MIKQINRVLEQQLFKESTDGRVGIGSKTPNMLTNFNSNVAKKKSNVNRQFIAKTEAASSTINIGTPKITTNANAQDKADRQNTARPASIGVKEAIASTITSIVGTQITNLILRTTDGSDFKTVDEYKLHQLIIVLKGGGKRPSATAIRQIMVNVMATTFDWRESAATNLKKLSTAITKAATYGVRFHNNMKGLVITTNVAYSAQQTWGYELAEAQCKTKVKYFYNKVQDADSIIDMMKYLATADEQHNRQVALAPENSETSNMVNQGIERLQQLVQQLPSNYASTNCNDESAMATTSNIKISVKKHY